MGKIHHTLDKLELEKDMFLLDIGCGWGYMLIEAAKKYHVKGIGITLSEEQLKPAGSGSRRKACGGSSGVCDGLPGTGRFPACGLTAWSAWGC